MRRLLTIIQYSQGPAEARVCKESKQYYLILHTHLYTLTFTFAKKIYCVTITRVLSRPQPQMYPTVTLTPLLQPPQGKYMTKISILCIIHTITVKPVFKGHSDEGTLCDQRTFPRNGVLSSPC